MLKFKLSQYDLYYCMCLLTVIYCALLLPKRLNNKLLNKMVNTSAQKLGKVPGVLSN